MRKVFQFVLIALLMSSCISMKKRVYIQNADESKSLSYVINKQEYKVSEQDILYITVKSLSEATLSNNAQRQVGTNDLLFYLNGYSVSANGEVLLPVVGSVYVLGKTLEEVKSDLQVKVDVYYKDAIIDVKTSGIKINILGEVASPGKYTFYQNRVTIFDALSISGDLSDLANRQEVKILRHTDGHVSVFKVDLTSDSILTSEFYFLQPNDVVYVEPLRAKTWGIGQTGWATFQTLLTTISSTLLIINFFKN